MSLGYYWEAHEALEHWFRQCGPDDPRRAFFHGILRLAAAGVKAREGNSAGVAKHARRAAELLHIARASRDGLLGLSIDETIEAAEAVLRAAASLASSRAGIGVSWSRRRLPGGPSSAVEPPKYEIDGEAAPH